ncbi:MAG: hypothetical protein AAB484_03075 [Patescibacteria group bacterium]
MKWVNILHLYQPPTQTREIVGEVVHDSYEKILCLLDQYPNLRLTLNISGSLLELLSKYGHQSVIDGFKKHAERGAIEFLASAMYHPILPLLEEKEILRQIRLHENISKKCFGAIYQPGGFYFPEMAYSENSCKAVIKAGFKWTVLDEIHATVKVDSETRYEIKDLKFGVVFRDSSYSRTFPPESIILDLEKIKKPYLVTCHDGELYGHWHREDHGYYKKAFSHPGITTITVSQYIDELEKETKIAVRDASWESKPDELKQNITLGLWHNPQNEIHNMLEAFKKEILTLVENHQDDPGYSLARHHADRGVASCAWWWASEKKIGPFSPVSWNPTEIEKGAQELYKAMNSFTTLSPNEISKTALLFRNLQKSIWQKHKQKYDPDYLLE